MNDVVPLNTRPNENAIATHLGLDPRDPSTHVVLAMSQRYDLDPVMRHVIAIPNSRGRRTPYITRDGLLHVAHRSGQLDGIVLEEQGRESGEWWARIAVYRKDMSHPFRYTGRYPMNGSNKNYGPEMAIKCAEALALRRAFDVTGLPVQEEMHHPAAQIHGPEWGRDGGNGAVVDVEPDDPEDSVDVTEGDEAG